ncbi:hypothetical protein OAO08_01520 [Candidatus Pelagibacter sp.]|nr:hypothetical protein [Candidatus Pelagibacter sp.]
MNSFKFLAVLVEAYILFKQDKYSVEVVLIPSQLEISIGVLEHCVNKKTIDIKKKYFFIITV